MAGMGREARVQKLLDLRMIAEVPSNRHCGGTLMAHAHMQGPQVSQQLRRFEGPQDAAVHATQLDAGFELAGHTTEHDGAGDDIGMAIEIFRCRMQDQVRAHGERPREHRRRHRGIGSQQCAAVMSYSRRGDDIGDSP